MRKCTRTAAMVIVCGTTANLSAQVGEGFEHGNEALYAAQGSMVDNLTINGAAAHTGSFGAQFDSNVGGFFTRLDVPTAPGNRYYARVRSRGGAGTSGGRLYVGVGASAGGAYSAVFGPNTGTIILQDNTSWGFNELASAPFVPAADTWYVLMLNWASNGDMTVSIWNDSMTSQLAATTTVATGVTTPGGISYRGFSGIGTVFSDTDDFGRANPGACCLPNGNCAILPSVVCLANNGIFSGDFSSCAASNCAKNYEYAGGSVAIPDGSGSSTCGTEVFAQASVGDNFTIQNAEASFYLTHTYQGDLVITLEKVGGPSVVLVDRPGVPAGATGFSTDNYGTGTGIAGRFIGSGFGAVSETFEHGNEALWNQETAGDNMTISSAGANNGRFGARFDSTGGGFRTRYDYYTSPGHRYVARVRSTGGTGGRTYVGVGATPAGAYSAVFAPNTSQIVVQNNSGWGFLDLASVAFVPVAGTWYSLVLDWAGNGNMTASIWDENMTTQLATTAAAVTNYLTPGGMSLRGFGSPGDFHDVDDFGSPVRIYDDPAAGGGFDGPTGRWHAEGNMSPFVGLSSQGNWRLRVKDCAGSDIGNLVAFTLLLQGPSGSGPCPPINGTLPNGPSTYPSTHGQQNGRLFRDGVPDTCALPGVPGAPIAGSYAYDKYDFFNSDAAPACVVFDINTACTGTNFVYAGAYVGAYDPNNPVTNNVASIGGSPNPTANMSFTVPAGTAFSIVVAEVTTGAGCPAYTFNLTGGNFCGPVTASCYANCDNSTNSPCLNVNDFICFNNRFSAGNPYANCDASTIIPVLNVNDFICFNNRFATGCSTPCAPHP